MLNQKKRSAFWGGVGKRSKWALQQVVASAQNFFFYIILHNAKLDLLLMHPCDRVANTRPQGHCQLRVLPTKRTGPAHKLQNAQFFP